MAFLNTLHPEIAKKQALGNSCFHSVGIKTLSEEFSVRPMRPINKLLLTLFDIKGWCLPQIASAFEYGISAQSIRRHFYFDSEDAFRVARLCEVAGVDTYPSAKILSGEIVEFLKRKKAVYDLTTQKLTILAWPGLEKDQMERYVHVIEKNLENGTRSGGRLARLMWVFKKLGDKDIQHPPLYLFESPKERKSEKRNRQMYLNLED